MKKYVFEAAKKQWEKPTEPHSLFVKPAKVTVCAENEEQAKLYGGENGFDEVVYLK